MGNDKLVKKVMKQAIENVKDRIGRTRPVRAKKVEPKSPLKASKRG